MFHAQKLFAETPRGMERSEVIGAKAAAFEERNGEGVANGHRYRRARGGREDSWSRLLLNADVQDHVAGFGERGMNFAVNVTRGISSRFQSLQQTNDFFGLAAVGDRQYGIAAGEHAHVSVQSLRRVQEKGRSPVLESVAEIFRPIRPIFPCR